MGRVRHWSIFAVVAGGCKMTSVYTTAWVRQEQPGQAHGRKEGKDYICSSRLGHIRWYDRFRSNRRIQQVKAIPDKVRYTNDILLPHELLHGASGMVRVTPGAMIRGFPGEGEGSGW